MSNSLNSNPIICYGVQTSYKAAVLAAQGTPLELRIARVEWFSPNAANDQALIIDPASGKEWLRFKCEVAGQSQIVPVNELWSDFAVVQCDSGVLKLFLV
ncbi:MAG: hypothetical protein LAN36_11465 [Acidobacteriia bacterium]|nr:hypothetical protein [Terriglobia bacterium]